MMQGEKPGGHGERCVAVGTLDMALWDAAAKAAGMPLHRYLAGRYGRRAAEDVGLYAAGGYRYPDDDHARLREELARFAELGHTRAKIKIGAGTLADDLARIAMAARIFPPARLAVDAMNGFGPEQAAAAADALAPLGLWWFEDVCDPLDFVTHAATCARHPGPIAAGEALFSDREAELLHRHGGMRPERDVLLFDPVHCYGVPGYLRIVATMERLGWKRRSFWPHGGHLFSMHVAAALGLGGSECNPLSFRPFCGIADDMQVRDGRCRFGDRPGIGLEAISALAPLLAEVARDAGG